MKLVSDAFAGGASIPRRHTCDGADTSPPLSWRAAPEATRSFALVVEDPDAPSGTWVHWVLFDIPVSTTALPEGAARESLPEGTREGVNGWGRRGYGGPCPPKGTHRYFFRLYALDLLLALDEGVTAEELIEAARYHVLARAELMGRYARE